MLELCALALTALAGNGHHDDHPLFIRSDGSSVHDGEHGGGAPLSAGGTLFYGGDFDFRAALNDERSNYRGLTGVYENFIVPEGGWHINAVFVNASFNYQSAGADFEIRSGVSAGNGGTLLFSGFGRPSTQQPTGRSWQGFEERTLTISDLDIELEPGEYWLMVRPVTFSCGGGWLLGRAGTTSGANGIGGPLGDGRSYFNGYGRNFAPTSDLLGAGTWDFSYGVQGVPEPMTWMALGTGIAVLLRRRRGRAR